ncbi:hypothetical protein ACOSQ2_009783 [Xanthoceras sorbifolium]
MGLGRWRSNFQSLYDCIHLIFGNLHLLKMCHYQPWEENSPEHELFTMDGNSLDELQALAEARLATLEARVVMIERKLELMEERLLFVRKGLYFVCACLFALMAAFAVCNV